jgi:Tfp pilus assembly protein PilO
MRTSTKRILSILLSSIFFIAFIVVVTSLVKPEFEQVMENRGEFYSKKKVFEDQQEAVGKVEQLIQETKSFNQLKQTVSLAVPLEKQIPNILNQLNAISRTSNVSIISFKSNLQAFEEGSSQLARRLGIIRIELAVSGDYGNLKNFLRFLESNVRVFNVKSFIISQGIQQQFLVQAETYYQE